MSASYFAVLDTGTTIDADGKRWPTAVIDTTGHPEIADLARVHAIEGVGDISTDAALLDLDADSVVAGSAEQILALVVSVTVPVTASFVLAFALPSQRPVLDATIAEGHLAIATGDPHRAAIDAPSWLAIDIDPGLLADVLPA